MEVSTVHLARAAAAFSIRRARSMGDICAEILDPAAVDPRPITYLRGTKFSAEILGPAAVVPTPITYLRGSKFSVEILDPAVVVPRSITYLLGSKFSAEILCPAAVVPRPITSLRGTKFSSEILGPTAVVPKPNTLTSVCGTRFAATSAVSGLPISAVPTFPNLRKAFSGSAFAGEPNHKFTLDDLDLHLVIRQTFQLPYMKLLQSAGRDSSVLKLKEGAPPLLKLEERSPPRGEERNTGEKRGKKTKETELDPAWSSPQWLKTANKVIFTTVLTPLLFENTYLESLKEDPAMEALQFLKEKIFVNKELASIALQGLRIGRPGYGVGDYKRASEYLLSDLQEKKIRIQLLDNILTGKGKPYKG